MSENEKLGAGVAEDCRSSSDNEDPVTYPGGFKLAIITLALCLPVFLVVLDNTIIVTAIPRITDHFKTIEDIGWYGSAYLLTTCAFQLFYGKLYSIFSIKYVYLASILIFEIGSTICGSAPSSVALILGRAIAVIGCAGIFSGTFTIIGFAVPLTKRPMYNGILGAVFGVSSVAGPLMGGAFTDNVSWRWCFYINLPIGAVAFCVVLFLFKSPPPVKGSNASWKAQIRQMDPFGTVALIAAVICLLLALQWGGSRYSWSDRRIIALLVLFGVLTPMFIAIQVWQGEDATVPQRIIKQRSVAGTSWFAFCTGGAFFILVYYIPIWFQAIKGVSAMKSGVMNLAMVLGMVVGSIFGGASITAVGYYTPFLVISSVLSTIGAGLLGTFTVHAGHSKWIGYQVLYGLGVGLSMQTPITVAQTMVSSSDIPTATALIMFLQTLGEAIFVSVGESIFTNKLLEGLTRTIDGLDAAMVINAGATALPSAVPADQLSRVLEEYNDALTQAWRISVALASFSIIGAVVVEWKSVKGNEQAKAAAIAD